MTVRTQLGMGEPARRELVAAVGHVLAAENAKTQHLLWRELRLEPGSEIAPHRLGPVIDVAMLHPVIDDDLPFHHMVNARIIQFARMLTIRHPVRIAFGIMGERHPPATSARGA